MSEIPKKPSPSKSQQILNMRKIVKINDIQSLSKKPVKFTTIQKSALPSIVKSKPQTIIRIVPSNIKTENRAEIKAKNTVYPAYVVKKSNSTKKVQLQKAVPSTSKPQSNLVLTDHEYNIWADKEIKENIIMDCDEYENQTNTELASLKDQKQPVQDLILPNSIKPNSCASSCRETLNLILKQQEEILKYFKHSSGFVPTERKLDLLPHMPFDDVNDFLDFDESLTNDNVQSQFMIKLKKLLVSTEQKSISNIMSSILTNELCKSISWIGIRDTVAFGTTNMVGMIVVSSKSEQQQSGYSQAAAVSETPAQQPIATTAPSHIAATSSSEEADSSEDDDGPDDDEDEGGGEDEDGDDEEGDDAENEDEEEGEEDEASAPDGDDEYEDELRAVAAAKKPAARAAGSSEPHAGAEAGDKEVSELLEYKRRKKTLAAGSGKASKDKRVPTVKKELSTQKEILIADNETQVQPNNPLHIEVLDRAAELPKEYMRNELQETENYEKAEQQQQPQPLNYESAYTVLRPAETLKKLSKRQGALLEDLKAYLLDVANREKLEEIRSEEDLLADSLLKFFATLAENPQRWNRVHQLLSKYSGRTTAAEYIGSNNIKADLDYSRQAVEAQKRLVQMTNPFIREATLTTTAPSSNTDRPPKKPKKKKKKKKKLRHHRLSATTSTSTEATTSPQPSPALAIATTETPWSLTTSSTGAAKWRLVAERLFGAPWSQENDDSNVAKVRYSMTSKPRTLSSIQRQLDDKERDSLKVLNSERQALMLKAAREYSQPRLLHFGKINTHQQTSSAEELEDAYESSERAYNRAHFGQLVSPSSSRLSGYVRPRERPVVPYQEQPSVQHPPSPHFDVNFARNQEYRPPGRDYAASKPWQAGRSWQNSWNWRQQQPQPEPQPVKPWLPWHTERDYFARLEEEEEETAKAWQQAQQRQQQQNWNRQNLRDNLPSWLEDKEVHRVQSPDTWESSRNNNSDLKSNDQSKQEDDSKEAPKLTMKTWNSLTSDPATWPFKLPGAKPWPKDENGKSYNPNAELVRKLGLYKNGRLRPDKDALKDLKQQKLQKNEKPQQGEIVPAEDSRPMAWSNKVPPKVNSWMEPDEQQSAWFNKWKQFAYHKVTAQPTLALNNGEKPNGKNAFIAVSAVSAPRYSNDWRKNDIEEIGQIGGGAPSEDPDHPSSQMRMSLWKKNSRTNSTAAVDKSAKIDVLENQLEDLKEKEAPVLLEVNVSIKNSTFHETPMPSTSTPEESRVIDKSGQKLTLNNKN